MTVDEMESLLERMGIEVVSTRGDEIQALCPAHLERVGRKDHKPSWFINAETGAHICFSCQFKGSLMYLIGYMNNYYDDTGKVDLNKAKEWVQENESLSDMFDRVTAPKAAVEEVKVDPAMLAAFSAPPISALKSRGLSSSAAEDSQLLWDERTESWIIPVFDGYTNELLGWQKKAYRGRYFSNYPTGMKKSRSLYCYTGSSDPVVLVESPLDAVRLRSLGLYGVASYGSYVSKDQINLLKSSSRLIVAMDNDDAGKAANERIISILPEMWMAAWFFDYSHTDQKDVGGMSKDEIMIGLQNAKHFLNHMAYQH